MLNPYNLRARIKAYKNRKLGSIVKFLKEKNNLSSNIVSLFGLICGLLGAYFMFSQHTLFIIFLLLAILFDVLDGAMAKIEKNKDKLTGWLIDSVKDRIVTTAILVQIALNANFKFIYIILAIFLLVSLLVHYEKIVHKRNLRIIYLDQWSNAFYIFFLYEIGLFVLTASMIINFILIIFQLIEIESKNLSHTKKH